MEICEGKEVFVLQGIRLKARFIKGRTPCLIERENRVQGALMHVSLAPPVMPPRVIFGENGVFRYEIAIFLCVCRGKAPCLYVIPIAFVS